MPTKRPGASNTAPRHLVMALGLVTNDNEWAKTLKKRRNNVVLVRFWVQTWFKTYERSYKCLRNFSVAANQPRLFVTKVIEMSTRIRMPSAMARHGAARKWRGDYHLEVPLRSTVDPARSCSVNPSKILLG